MHVFRHAIGEIIVSDEVWAKRFACDLAGCKGSCCRIGDLGASLLPEEAARLEGMLPRLLPRLPEKNRKFLAVEGLTETYRGRLHIREMARNHPCPLGLIDGHGVLLCSLHDLAEEEGLPVFLVKPVWCQFYPLVLRDTATGCLINVYEAEFCRSLPDAPPILLAFADTLEKTLGPDFVAQVRQRYREEGIEPGKW